jgi:formylmethanofuran dehydrogenase subunit B
MAGKLMQTPEFILTDLMKRRTVDPALVVIINDTNLYPFPVMIQYSV